MRKFTNESNYNGQKVILGTSPYVVSTNKYGSDNSIDNLNNIILKRINEYYSKYGYSRNSTYVDIVVDGFVINSEYINKMVNNYLIFKNIIILNKIDNESDFYNFMFSNLDEIYLPKGKYFKSSLSILRNTSNKGNRYEVIAKNEFIKYVNEKNIDILIINSTFDEDLSGIDFKFKLNNKEYTVQTKPYIKYEIFNDIIRVESVGSTSLSTDYLILVNNKSVIILRNPKKDSIKINNNYFETSINNIVKK